MRNIELKARLNDRAQAETVCAKLPATFQEDIQQTDTYFTVPKGRLKLRESSPGQSQLIYYNRPDIPTPKPSDYTLQTVDPALRDLLTQALGQLAIVRKTRSLWLWENVRIHLDTVQDLGEFIEFEAVLDPKHNDLDGHQKLDHLKTVFSIGDQDLQEKSYLDLTLARQEIGHHA